MSCKGSVFRGRESLSAAVLGVSLAACLYALTNGNRGSEPAKGPLAAEQSIPVLSAKILKTYPHDAEAFTQGLEYYDGFLYESTGRTGHSSLRKVDLASGKVLQKVDLSSEYFGEGLTIFRGKVYQLTWLSEKGFVYDVRSFAKLGAFHYYGEGWGLTHDGAHLILSDGTNRLRYIDPETFQVTRTLEVYGGKEAVTNLNELECVGDDIYANVWHANRIARIEARTGQVRAWIDFSALASQEQNGPEGVLNGIAFDSARRRFFVTGKNWAHLFEVRVEGLTF